MPEKFHGVIWDVAFWTHSSPPRLVVMEVNHYGSSGGKPPAIAREYTERQPYLDEAEVGFIWVTDGLGWHDMMTPLRDAFYGIHHLINIQLAREGYLEWAFLELLARPRIKQTMLDEPMYTPR